MRFIVSVLLTGLLCMQSTAFAGLQEMQKDIDQRIQGFEKFAEYTGNTLVHAASDPTFKSYFLTTDPAEKKRLKHKIDFLSLNTQAKFKVDEMCLIDHKGKEISRIVYAEVAPDKELSSEEASAPFFNPAFSEEDGNFHFSAPYVSADSLRWVACFATPIVLADGSKPGIYHYEVSQYVLQGVLNKGLTATTDKFLLIVNSEGYVVSDSRQKFKLEYNVADTEMKTPFSDYFPELEKHLPGMPVDAIKNGKSGDGSINMNGKILSYLYQPIGYNDWSAILVSP